MESIPYNTFDISDELMTLLFAGVGIYSTIDNTICPNYQKTVLDLASSGQLAYIVSDISICYGTNYPINRVIVTDEFALNHSINTLFQLFGRAGRVGRSWIAVVYISDIIAREIIKYTQEKNYEIVEATNMIKVFNNYVHNTDYSDNEFLEQLFVKYDLWNKNIHGEKTIGIKKKDIIEIEIIYGKKELLSEKETKDEKTNRFDKSKREGWIDRNDRPRRYERDNGKQSLSDRIDRNDRSRRYERDNGKQSLSDKIDRSRRYERDNGKSLSDKIDRGSNFNRFERIEKNKENDMNKKSSDKYRLNERNIKSDRFGKEDIKKGTGMGMGSWRKQ